MKYYLFLFCLLLLVLTQFSCENKKKENQKEIPELNPVVEKEKPGITIENFETNAFPDAVIEMYSPLGNESFAEGNVPFEFNIKNYPKNGGPERFVFKMAINGDAPVSYHMPAFKRTFNSGTYRAVAYLLDKEGIALKEFGNYVQRDFIVGDSQPFPESDEPYMVLNLPENDQVFSPGEPVTVDILLIGGGLEEDGLKFILLVDGMEQEVQEPYPVNIKNLPPGIHDIQVKLVKASGEELSGIFSAAKRQITVEN